MKANHSFAAAMLVAALSAAVLVLAGCGGGGDDGGNGNGASNDPAAPAALPMGAPTPSRVVPDAPASGAWDATAASSTGNQSSEYLDWNAPAGATAGYKTIYQTFMIRAENPQAMLFPASQWGLRDNSFYFGIQIEGTPGALFSFFGPDASTTSANCHSGADTGDGISCHIDYPWQIGRPYTFWVSLDASDGSTETWSGWINDDLAGWKPVQIGNFTIPASNGYATPQGGFIEAFDSPGGSACSALWQIDAVFGRPIGLRPDGSADQLGLADAYTNGCAATFHWQYYSDAGISGAELVQGTR
jgi:Domain of unknown function (DUF3472)